MITYGSVCSGIESASVAWEPLGMRPSWFSEIEPFPSAVLAHHWPNVPNLGDMTNLAAAIRAGMIEAPDVLVGGTPCQAFSVAGLRGGLSDGRGQLTLTYVDILNAIDEQRPDNEAVCVWENVPGVLSSKDNAFGCFLAALVGEDLPLEPTGKKWPNAGCVYGPQRTAAWRILDAQYFGVAQRRRRVFVVASARKGFNPATVLFESEGVRRDSAPCREAGKAVAALTANGVGTCDADDNQAQAGHLVTAVLSVGDPELMGTLCAQDNEKWGCNQWVNEGKAIVQAFQSKASASQSMNPAPISPTLDASKADGIAISLTQYGSEMAGTLTASNGSPCHDRGQNMVASFKPGQGSKAGGIGYAEELAPTLTATDSGTQRSPGLLDEGVVRRLTPVECERLQGFPDNHTLIPWKNKPAESCPDGPRYKAAGNSKAVPVVQWIGVRLLMGLL